MKDFRKIFQQKKEKNTSKSSKINYFYIALPPEMIMGILEKINKIKTENYINKFKDYIKTNHPNIVILSGLENSTCKVKLFCDLHKTTTEKIARNITTLSQQPCAECGKELRVSNQLERRGVKHHMQSIEIKEKTSKKRIDAGWLHLTEQEQKQRFDKVWIEDKQKTEAWDINSFAEYFKVPREVCYGHLIRLGITLNGRMVSAGEKSLSNFIESLGVVVETSNRKILGGKEIDIYIPSQKLGIEYNGVYWHSEDTGSTKDSHKIKLDLCKRQGVRLIQIWEDDWTNRGERCKSIIKNALGLNSSKLNARDYSVEIISKQDFDSFLEVNHIQGTSHNSSIRICLKENDKVVSVMGFKIIPKNVSMYGPNGYELTRFANTGVRGAFSKLEKYFVRTYNPNFILSFADLEIVDEYNNIYKTNKYEISHYSEPDYKYAGKLTGWNRDHKFNWRKSKFKSIGFDIINKTEDQLRIESNLVKVWDSGKIAYVKRFY